jgi:hypothetical protein
MQGLHRHATASWIGRVAAVLVMCALIPQVVAETQPESETSIAVQRESTPLAESCGPCVCHGKLDHELHTPGHRTGPAALIGHDGRRLSATLLAPMRC